MSRLQHLAFALTLGIAILLSLAITLFVVTFSPHNPRPVLHPHAGQASPDPRLTYRREVDDAVKSNAALVSQTILQLASPYLTIEDIASFEARLEIISADMAENTAPYLDFNFEVAGDAAPPGTLDERQLTLRHLERTYSNMASMQKNNENDVVVSEAMINQWHAQFRDYEEELEELLTKTQRRFPSPKK